MSIYLRHVCAQTRSLIKVMRKDNIVIIGTWLDTGREGRKQQPPGVGVFRAHVVTYGRDSSQCYDHISTIVGWGVDA
jgi:hypothetical protein